MTGEQEIAYTFAPPTMERFDGNQAVEYWKSQHTRAGKLDDAEDPDALGNVCHAGAPAWFNQYYARHQSEVFEQLLALVPTPAPGSRALDIGCGAGRWCRRLATHGYAVHGIDLQQALVDADRKRYPQMRFDCVAIQNFAPDVIFDVITTVTVLQHIPFHEQELAIARIGSLVRPGGHVLILENVRDQGVHVFARSIEDWQRLFQSARLRTVATRRYDYSPAIRASGALVAAVANLGRQLGVLRKPVGANANLPRGAGVAERAATDDPADVAGDDGPVAGLRQALRTAGWLSRKAAVAVDDRIEPLLIQLNARLPTVHCGFLFQKEASP